MGIWMFPETCSFGLVCRAPLSPSGQFKPCLLHEPSLASMFQGSLAPSSELQWCVIHSTFKSGPVSLFSLLCAFPSSPQGGHRVLDGFILGVPRTQHSAWQIVDAQNMLIGWMFSCLKVAPSPGTRRAKSQASLTQSWE